MAQELLETLARRVIDARRDYDLKYKAKVKAEKEKKRVEAEMNEEMMKAKITGTTLELGPEYGHVQFSREQKINSSVFDEAAAIAYFEKMGMLKGYVEGKVRKKPLNQLVREAQENGHELPDGVEPRITKYVKVTRRDK